MRKEVSCRESKKRKQDEKKKMVEGGKDEKIEDKRGKTIVYN